MVRRGVPARNWSMNVTERATPSARPADARSPFVRLAELLAGIEPGQPAINIAVGEPQHPIPAFVGPVLAAHLADFGRYPANAGTERFRQAVAGMAQPPLHARPPDRSGERNPRPFRHARRPVPRRDRGEALGQAARRQARDADPEPVLRGLCGRQRSRPIASRSISTPPRRTASCPISTRSRPSCSRAPSRSISPRRPIRKARSPTPPTCSA